ncbi:ParB N-terminal domain-containing protein [Mammaliicoccus sciuri]|uniref:hypothetical protein n=1 Tax=Mammaliicoccus sciuri TaxID=1296 RepID=UPI0021D0599E|nr:hypothetical protein [Mammaliicoccus sciuri]UXU70154.1 hypothetical protein MUA36_05595 [Mammaliicoccus sciuri]
MEKHDMLKNIVQELRNQNTDEMINKISSNMEELYKIPEGVTKSFVIRELDKNFFQNTDIRVITLFIMEAFKVLGRGEYIDKYIPIGEQQEAKQYDFVAYKERDNIKLPYEISPVVKINDLYSCALTVKQIAELLNSGILNYNFEIQREAKLETRTNEIIKKPTINKINIKEIEQHLLNDTLKESTLYFNAAPMTSDDGDEIIYNSETGTIMLTKGTRIDILDGYHRVLAAQEAYRLNPSIDFEFNVIFSNFSTSEATRWQAQHSKATPWSRNRITEMQQESRGAKVVKTIKDQDVEFGKIIYTGKSMNETNESLITFNMLKDTVDKNFDIKTRHQEVAVAEKLSGVLLDINDLKKSINGKFSQNIVVAFIVKYANEYQNRENEFSNVLKELSEYIDENGFDFAIKSSSKNKQQDIANKKIEDLFEKACNGRN